MRLMRVGAGGAERPVVLDADDRAYHITPVAPRIDGAFLASDGLARVREALASDRLRQVDIAAERVGAPIERPGTVVCIGLNYTDHAAETGAAVPSEPVVFLKASNAVIGPHDDVLLPRGSTKTDWEVELTVVLGGVARYLESPAAAYDVIAGYAVSHDVSEREFQLERGGQWTKGKSCETFNPLGPWLVTADEVPDPQNLGLRLWVNGRQRQNGTTKDMVFDVGHLVWYLSQFMVLEPGDVVNTGTPAGVALGRPDHPYLRPGDVVELEIDGLGRQRQTVRKV
jgi:2-keto-4-pentenoate hydratase/2-oxohepta-3-ene-1,7-dioic acid hydratase in catechol pathway